MASKGSTSSANTPTTDDQTEIPEQDATATPDTQTSGSSGSGSGGVNGSPRGTADGNGDGGSNDTPADEPEDEVPSGPVVVNDANGQHVDVPQEDGSVKTVYTRAHNLPVTNAEQAQFELTHLGDGQLRYPYVPGDLEYSPYSDPAVPDSHQAKRIEIELASYGERVMKDPKAAPSPIWNSHKGIYDEELQEAIDTGSGTGKVRV